jgi:hypothetical protein
VCEYITTETNKPKGLNMIYKVIDNYGTRKHTWTYKGAVAWLPYCGKVAVIGNMITRKVITTRVQG